MITSEEFYANLKRVRELKTEKQKLKDQEKTINKELGELSEGLIEYFDMNDIPRQSLDGSLFYVSRTPHYSISDEDSFFSWMRSTGDLDLCMAFNANKFKGYYKEKKENGEELPPGISEFIKTDVRVRKENTDD